MIETGKLSEFNESRNRNISECSDVEIANVLGNNIDRFPKTYYLLTETTKFYTEYFSDLQKFIKREKRLVVFETPSRVLMTHEYTIECTKTPPQGFYFLFNTRERLSWLKIFIEDKRVSIASRTKVISLLMNLLKDELGSLAALLHTSKEDIASRLYDASDGKPCFIEFNYKDYKGQQSLLLSITFFDSIREKASTCMRWWSPLQEKKIHYNYSTISGNANAWIYFKSPANFVISTSHNATEGNIEVSPSNDHEITSLVLTPRGEKISVDFVISVDVPDALKIWYNSMFYLACIGVVFGIALHFFIGYSPNSCKVIEPFNNCAFAIIAALIATRGWLMAEEQVMKKMSNWYTFIICILLFLVLSLSFVTPEKMDNKVTLPTKEEIDEQIFQSSSNVYDIKKDVKNKVTDSIVKFELWNPDPLNLRIPNTNNPFRYYFKNEEHPTTNRLN